VPAKTWAKAPGRRAPCRWILRMSTEDVIPILSMSRSPAMSSRAAQPHVGAGPAGRNPRRRCTVPAMSVRAWMATGPEPQPGSSQDGGNRMRPKQGKASPGEPDATGRSSQPWLAKTAGALDSGMRLTFNERVDRIPSAPVMLP
jgi:hypothetical protein